MPLSIVRVSGLALIEKLETVTDNRTSCTSVPLVPVTSTPYVPGLVEGATWIVSMDVCPGLIVVGLGLAVRPMSAVAVRSTGELNPFSAVMDIVEVLEAPAAIVGDDGLAEIVKSGPTIVTVTIV